MKAVPVLYHLCPRCFRAVPAAAHEIYCPNDGSKMLVACPDCSAAIVSPYARFCVSCGRDFAAIAASIGGEANGRNPN